MNDDQNKKDVQKITDDLDALVEEAKQFATGMDEDNKRTNETFDEIEADVDKSVREVDEITADLDSAEKEAGEEIDKLLINRAEEVATLEKEDKNEGV